MFNLERSLMFGLTAIQAESTDKVTDESLVEAMTLNKIFSAERLTMYPEDIVKLASASKKCRLTAHKGYKKSYGVWWGEYYYDYPEELMEKDEAVYQFQKLVHYFSDAGLDDFKNEEVSKGWLSETKFKKRKDDTPKIKKYRRVRVLNKQELLDVIKEEIVNANREWVYHETCCFFHYMMCNKELSVELPYKKNIRKFYSALLEFDTHDKFEQMKQVCHTVEDVMTFAEAKRHSWYRGSEFIKFETSTKRLISKLLDLMPAEELEKYLSDNKKEGLIVLNWFSYTKFSKNEDNKEVVRKFRSGEYEPWNSIFERKMRNNESDLLDFLSEKPDVFYRNLRKLLVKGCSKEEILDHIKGAYIDPFIILHAIEDYCNPRTARNKKPMEDEFIELSKHLLVEALAKKETPLTGKKVYFADKGYSLENSCLYTLKRNHGKQVKVSLAYKIPDEIDKIRFYIYWNNPRPVKDFFYHATAVDKNNNANSYCSQIENIDFNNEFPLKTGIEYVEFSISKLLKTKSDSIFCEHPKSTFEKVNLECSCHMTNHFASIKECVLGATVAEGDPTKEKPENYIFEHNLTYYEDMFALEALLDLNTKVVRFLGSKEKSTSKHRHDGPVCCKKITFSLKDYLDILAKAQNITYVDNENEADIVMSFDRQKDYISLKDNNFFI